MLITRLGYVRPAAPDPPRPPAEEMVAYIADFLSQLPVGGSILVERIEETVPSFAAGYEPPSLLAHRLFVVGAPPVSVRFGDGARRSYVITRLDESIAD